MTNNEIELRLSMFTNTPLTEIGKLQADEFLMTIINSNKLADEKN